MGKISTSVTTSLLSLSLILGASSGVASANELTEHTPNINQEQTQISQNDIIQLKTFLNDYGVNQKTQNTLLNKLESGEIWDSLKKNEKPTHSYETENNDVTEKVEVYKDGSIIVTSINYEEVEEVNEISENKLISPLAVSPGTVTGGSGYKNFKKAKVYYNSGIANAHFYANFTIVFGGNDYISNVYDQKVTAIGGSASDISLKRTRAKETLDNKASAKLSFNFTNFNNTGSTTAWLKLFVGKDSYSESHSF